ncbi:amino acid ABC transporter permease [Pseudomonas arsenicoxydans]|uniref:Amino acid ABC transporter permease n=1 Tax=Pseudomonas arsenicoxydans TaxID=702115 RepID=A0A502HM06_9PSED|nr:amino acid ABC transporter permease [Pseudomonas arsenicoxydans]TPG75839.1 amino acid ABC transporter permease [Pseudomonas arsenicoxydans]
MSYIGRFLGGIAVSVELTLLSFAIAIVLGLLLAIMRVSPWPPFRWFASSYVELMQMMPLLALLLLFTFGLPKLGFIYSLFTSTVLVLGLYSAAWICEVVRAGINTVSIGQIEAARSIGMRFDQILGEVVLPQAVQSVIGPLGNLFIIQIKASAIGAAIGVADITYTAQKINFDTALAVPTFLGAMGAYFLLTLPAGWFFRFLEQKMAVLR